ncbi:homoprotocatechuate degradation operon regulator HpaR [Thiolinea disciformis]|uniref:homoprotocatechuate degradation operon regulator HpaR n=1 Tax=Thiolinea disciformis TaxID=125614 RepID=UPI00037E6E1E|nr:homoprotocatechuate degradation operon regulator HpaR [Thiolinea disciformis]
MTQKIPQRNLPLLLLQAREVFMPHFRPILNYAGLTEQQWRILRVLHEIGALEPRQICEHCMIYSSSLAGILKRMEELTLITRYPVEQDKRRMLIDLTEKSRALITEVTPLIIEQYHYVREAFGVALVDQLYDSLDALIAQQERSVKRVSLPQFKALSDQEEGSHS